MAIDDKQAIIICDCISCRNTPTWKQGFWTRKGLAIIDLCEAHHFVLRTKVPGDVPLDEDVLKWLLIQDSNHYSVAKYGVIRKSSDLEMMKELSKIELDIE